jgi:hypothetical protein
MTPHEKAVNAINARLERLQANLAEAKSEATQRFLVQAVVVSLATAEALNDYIRAVGSHAQRRHAEVKQAHASLEAQHAELLASGKDLLEKLKASPADEALRKQIDSLQQSMAAVQKSMRRGANALQRELAPGVAMIDDMAVTVRRFSEADQPEALKRVLNTAVTQVARFYATHDALPAKDVVDAARWERSALSEIDAATDFYDRYARTGYQITLALELLALALSETPPQNAPDATDRANDAAGRRIKAVTARFTAA